MWQTLTNARNAGIVGLICGTTPALFAVLAFERTGGMSIGLRVGLISGLMSWLFIGGRACVQHFILRFILWQNGYIPWNYARFLNYATERMFLQRVGGRYRFIHRLLQEHFAQMELNQE
jgi:hypothetical protein